MEGQEKKVKKKPTKMEEMTKEQIRQAIIKRRECNVKAQATVESLLESGITEAYFIQCLPDINQSHFEDIIEERAILHLCGYPVCPKTLSEKDIPKQKYRISLKTNKVYDITARKSFCSNGCYNSAMHIKKQMLTSPLWFREYEDIPTFHLMPIDSTGSLGQEIDVSLVERIKIKAKPSFTSVNDFASATLNDMDEYDKKGNIKEIENKDTAKEMITEENTYTDKKCNENKSSEILHCIKQSTENLNENNTQNLKSNDSEVSQNPPISKTIPKKINPNPLNIVGEIVERPERKIDPILLSTPESNDDITEKAATKDINLSAKKVTKKKAPAVTVLTIEVEKCLAEWCTLDTLLLLFGEEKVKEMVADKGERIKEYLNNYAKTISYNAHTYDQYQALCRKLNMLELEDRKQDAQALNRETKPLPDYSIIKEESKKMQLKVKAFFSGETEIPELETIEQTKNTEDDASVSQIPLVDKNAQNALRRRIVCEHLNKVLPDLLRSLGLLQLSISSDVRLIVNTFKLEANNIMFKPIQWTLIAIIIIKLLSLRDKRLECLLEQPTAYQHMQLLLLSYKQEGGYLDRLICWLTDVDRLLDTNDTQLSVIDY